MLNSLLSKLVSTQPTPKITRSVEIKEETRHQSPSLSLSFSHDKSIPSSCLSPPPPPLSLSKNTRVYFEPRNSLPLNQHGIKSTRGVFCSPDRASRRPRFFGGRRPRPDAGASDQSSPPASRITGAARKQPPGCFVLPSRPSPGIASRFSSPFFPLTDREETIEGKNGRWTEDATPREGRSRARVYVGVCGGDHVVSVPLSLSLHPPPRVSGFSSRFIVLAVGWMLP